MSEYLYELEVVKKDGSKMVLKTNDATEYQRWLEEYRNPQPQRESKQSKRVLLKG